ncbi:MAG: sulfatase [Verrucomicrobia bacterium]|nr:sulfatase [Verrucomicrobiota bacterium]MDA1068752.1 sulfatase [Verrucomicrobiota bacterium]
MKTHFRFLKPSAIILTLSLFGAASFAESPPLNILLFTADDLHRDSLGCYGSTVEDISPNLDRFANNGIRFTNAHVNTAICEPSRKILASGLYGFNSGSMGFLPVRDEIVTVQETLGAAGYMTGVIGKLVHSTPKYSYQWDYAFDRKDMGDGRNPTIYYERTAAFLKQCKEAGKPFYFMANSEDPHLPWYDPEIGAIRGAEHPSRIYAPEEVTVPSHLPDVPGIRVPLSHYYNSTKRMDDTFGKVMQALDESGMRENTLIVFLSDNGMATPFAKCNTYLASTLTPLLVQWPGVVKAGSQNDSLVAGVDFFPTVLDALGMKSLKKSDGRSLLAVLKGQANDAGRDYVYTQVDSKVDLAAIPMRCIQNKKYGYIYNMWVRDGYYYRNNNEVAVMRTMEAAAATDPAVLARVQMYRYRTLEELYDLDNDPGCLTNLAESPKYKDQLATMRKAMENRMKSSGDPLLKAYRNKTNSKIVAEEFNRIYPTHNPVINRAPWEKF